MNLIEWLLYAAACKYVSDHLSDKHLEWTPAARVVCAGAKKRGLRYRPGIFDAPARAHVNRNYA